METLDSSLPPWKSCLPKAVGLLASLIYLDSTATAINHFPNSGCMDPKAFDQWDHLRLFRTQLEATRQRLVVAMHSLYLEGIDDTLDSFTNATRFYETAISGYRNTLLHMPPITLGEVLALCSFSYAILRSAGNQISFDFSHLEIWRNAITNHEHRPLFEDLINAACLEPHLSSQNFCPLSIWKDDSHLLQPSYQDEPGTIPTTPGNDIANDVLGSILDLDHTVYDFLSGSPITGQTAQFNHTVSTTAPDLQDLQRSTIIRNLSRFLEDCGQLTFVLSSPSSRRMKIQSTQSELGNRIEPLYIQRLRNDNAFDDPRSQAIISIISSFTNLGYLQSVNEAGHYMLLLGNETIPSEDFFPCFSQSVVAAVNKVEQRTASSHGKRLRLSQPERIPCEICEEVLTRKNMKRHLERKHLCVGAGSRPAMFVNAK